MFVHKDSTSNSLGLVLMVALLQSACATTSSEQMLRFDAAPFDRPASGCFAPGDQHQTSLSCTFLRREQRWPWLPRLI